MDKINVRHILLVLDICQGGTIFEQERGNVPAPAIHDIPRRCSDCAE